MRKLSVAGLAAFAMTALAATSFSGVAVAGPITVLSAEKIAPDSPTTPVYYRSYCGRPYVRHWRYRHYTACGTCAPVHGYGYSYPSDRQYGWDLTWPVTAPVAAAADVAAFPFTALFGGW
jgi:hypothetical protein